MQRSSKPVILNYTLRHLYSLDGGQHSDIILAYAFPTPRIQVASSLPLTGKFIYQSPLTHFTSKRALAIEFLQSISQRYGLIAGETSLVLFELDDDEAIPNQKGTPTVYQIDAMDIYGQLILHQTITLTVR